MIVSFEINGITVQANGETDAMIKSGILSHLIEIEKIAAVWKTVVAKHEAKELPKKDVEDLDFDSDKNPEEEEKESYSSYNYSNE